MAAELAAVIATQRTSVQEPLVIANSMHGVVRSVEFESFRDGCAIAVGRQGGRYSPG
jgi:hypothetical protein